MKKHLIVTTAFLGLIAAPAIAQAPSPAPGAAPGATPAAPMAPAPAAPTPAAPAPSAGTSATSSSSAAAGGAGFISEQKTSQWLASNVIGASVVGPDNKTIGEINDFVIDQSGTAEAAVVGVGGFLGVGEKDVAIPFKSLQITRKENGMLDKVTLPMTKADLEKAPTFMSMADKQAKTKTGTAGTSNPMPTGSTKPAQ